MAEAALAVARNDAREVVRAVADERGALLAQLPGRGRTALEALTLEEWVSATRVANAAGGLTTTAKGAIPAMPDSAAIQACVQAMGRCAFDA